MSDYMIQLTLTKDQANVVLRACDMLERIHLGQWDMNIPMEVLMYSDKFNELDFDERIRRKDECQILLCKAQNVLMGNECRSQYGIAYNIKQVLRHTIAMHEHPEGGCTVQFDKPRDYDGSGLPGCIVV